MSDQKTGSPIFLIEHNSFTEEEKSALVDVSPLLLKFFSNQLVDVANIMLSTPEADKIQQLFGASSAMQDFMVYFKYAQENGHLQEDRPKPKSNRKF